MAISNYLWLLTLLYRNRELTVKPVVFAHTLVPSTLKIAALSMLPLPTKLYVMVSPQPNDTAA